MVQILLQIHNYWKRFSLRERRLILGVLVVGTLFLLNLIYHSTIRYISDLENTLDRLQEDLINYTHQLALKQSVESEYAQVARQHSSKWTEAEIHDRLRQELYRLAQKYPPELNEEGIPIKTLTSTGALVEIPSLQQGILRTTDRNYREYTLNVKLPPSNFSSMIQFLQRLQSSPQSLRIDNLDLRRHPLEEKVSADMDITRIITAGMPVEGGSESSSVINLSLDPVDWNCIGGTMQVEQDAQKKVVSLVAESAQDTMELSYVRSFPPGEKWTLEIEIGTKATGYIQVSSPDNIRFEGKEALKNDGTIYRYKLSMSLPDSKQERLRVRIPHLVIQGNGSKIYIYNGNLSKVG